MVVKTIMCQSEFQCSVETHNTKNFEKILDESEEFRIITYRCATLIFNLSAGDISCLNVEVQILYVFKYFRTDHFANTCFQKSANSES